MDADLMKRRKKRTMALNFVLFLGPTLLLYLVIEVIPLIMGVVYSFTDWDGIATEIGFVGFKNYIDLFTDDPRFWKSMLFTFENTAVVVIVSNLIGFVLAYNLSKKIPFRNFMRAAFYLPRLIGGVILGFVWQFIFLNIFPFLGEKFGIGVFQLSWLGTPATSFWALAIVQAWGFAGYMMIIYVAGLTAISSDYIEAAVIDGATAGQQLRHVILPLMMPAGGGPYRSSEAITMNVYTTAFAESQLGYGSAKAIIMALVIIAVTLLQVKLTSKKEVQM